MSIPLNIDWQQILLHLFNFAILAGGLYVLLYSPVKKFMDNRLEYYKSMENEAEECLKKAELSQKEYAEKLKNADAEIEQKRQEAQKIMDDEAENSRLSAKKEAEKIVSDARKRAEAEHDKLIEGARGEIADMITTATERILLKSDTAESFEQFLATAERGADNEQ